MNTRCPPWCASDHQCTIKHGHPAGVHASDPMRWNTAYGSLVVVRQQNRQGRDWLELRATAALDADSTQELAAQLAVQVDLAIRKVVLAPLQAAIPILQKGH